MKTKISRSTSWTSLGSVLWLLSRAAVHAEGASGDAAAVTAPTDPQPADAEHESARAGEAFATEFLGYQVNVEERDRGDTMAMALGATIFSPKIASTEWSPLASFYYLGDWDDRRFRAQVSGLVNDLEFAERFHGFEGIVRLANDDRRLFAESETVSGQDLGYTELEWGREALWLGPGWALDLAPFNVDNQLRLQLFYRAGYEHFAATDKTDATVPDDTWVHGPSLRIRVDALQRNLLEIPHYGFAFGLDAEALRRDHWDEGAATSVNHHGPLTDLGDRDFLKISGYGLVAGGLPFLSDRNVFTGQVRGGWAPTGTLDRFSGFRIGGGPLPRESDDLIRLDYPGALFDQFISDQYILATASYRYELFFFMYLRASVTLFHGRIISIDDSTGASRFRTLDGQVPSAALISGFPWASTVEIEYDYDTRLVRGGVGGSQVLLMWAKQF